MYSVAAGRERDPTLSRSLLLASGAIVTALAVSLFLSEIVRVRLPVYAQVHLYGATFIASRIGGWRSGVAAFCLALGVSDFFLTEPVYELFVIDDLPDFITFGLAAAASIWIGCLGRKLADGPKTEIGA